MHWHSIAIRARFLYRVAILLICCASASPIILGPISAEETSVKVKSPQIPDFKITFDPFQNDQSADPAEQNQLQKLAKLEKQVPATIKKAVKPKPIAKLLMFKTVWCDYCQHFEKHVRPSYQVAAVSKAIALHEIDFHVDGTDYYPLKDPVTVFPTFVIFKDGKEFKRIAGYMGKKNFLKTMNDLFPQLLEDDLAKVRAQVKRQSQLAE